jgi:hypothetical protein
MELVTHRAPKPKVRCLPETRGSHWRCATLKLKASAPDGAAHQVMATLIVPTLNCYKHCYKGVGDEFISN